MNNPNHSQTWASPRLKNPFHCRSRREEAQIANGFAIDQSLVTSAPTILRNAFFVAGLLLASAGGALAAVRYVDVNGASNAPPYTSWATAATNIQNAVDAALAGDEIVVTNGIYATGERAVSGMTNRVAVDKPVNVRSVNGPQFTTIDGGQLKRSVYLTNGARLSGFTLTHGRAVYGGGLWCESTNAVASNCVVSGNSTFWENHPVIIIPCCRDYTSPAIGGGVYGGTLNDCILSNNWVETFSYAWFDCDLSTCHYVSGHVRYYYFPGSGGGAYGCTLNNCTLTSNSAGYGGGAYRCTLNNCALIGNSAYGGGGYGSQGGGAYYSILNNCILAGNSAIYGGGVYVCTLNNCTLAGNQAHAYSYDEEDGSYYEYGIGGGAFHSTLNNCILYFNTAPDGANHDSFYDSHSILNYSCTTPLPTNGVGNITRDPGFVDLAGGNLRLQPGSPCVNAGSNTFVLTATDLDGNPRIADGTVDIGAYELPLTPTIALGRLVLFVNDANLGSRNKQPLLATLSAAMSSLERDNQTAALNQLAAFQNKVRAQLAPWNPALANEMIATSQTIFEVVSRREAK